MPRTLTSSLTDAELVAELASGSTVALAEVYRRHSGPVFGFALRIVRDREMAEDVAQEVFLRLWKRPTAFDPGRGSLRTFLLTHARGRAIDLIRSEGSRRMREERDGRLALVATPSIEEELLDMQMAEETRRALAELDDDQRAAIELAFFGGYTYKEVAEILDAPEGTVKSRIRLGMKRMHGRLSGLVTAG